MASCALKGIDVDESVGPEEMELLAQTMSIFSFFLLPLNSSVKRSLMACIEGLCLQGVDLAIVRISSSHLLCIMNVSLPFSSLWRFKLAAGTVSIYVKAAAAPMHQGASMLKVPY